jgi:hypothetical protein
MKRHRPAAAFEALDDGLGSIERFPCAGPAVPLGVLRACRPGTAPLDADRLGGPSSAPVDAAGFDADNGMNRCVQFLIRPDDQVFEIG